MVRVARLASCVVVGSLLLTTSRALAQPVPPAGHADTSFDFMNLLAQHDLHDLHDEIWNAYGQLTYISNWKLGFSAPYTNANGTQNSLVTDPERSYTGTFTLYFGVRLWPGATAYLVPEFVAERGLSNLKGLGGSIQNFELQKSGSEYPTLYKSQLFVRQKIELGGRKIDRDSDPMVLGGPIDSRRVVLTGGTFTALDVFDHNNVAWDPRQTFINMAFMTHASWDFAADARGYSLGLTAELYWDDWAMRLGTMAPPLNPNVLPINTDLVDVFADTFEIEHDHEFLGQKGAVRLLGYANHEVDGAFSDAIAAWRANPALNAAACPSNVYSYGSGNAAAPALCWVRRPNTKVGIGINLEQYVATGVGLFLRAMYSDGRTEVDAFNSADRDLSIGAVAKGTLWRRPLDVAGLGFASSWISDVHAQFLALGGSDGFIGDGHLRQAPEMVVDAFYSFNLLRAIWLTADYQRIWNPGFNADRAGPVDILGGRVHVEF